MTGQPQPASKELIALAAKARPDWNTDDVCDALARARYDAMSWAQILVCMGRLLANPDAEPEDLAAHAPEEWRHHRQAPAPSTYERGIAQARALAEAARARTTHTTRTTAPEEGPTR